MIPRLNASKTPSGRRCVLFILFAATICRAGDAQLTQTCRGEPLSAREAAAANTPSSHSHPIKLTWVASVPASAAKPDAVAGYVISRHESGKSCDVPGNSCVTLNPSVLIRGTGCVDAQVLSGHKYTYQARAVSVSKKVSGYSKEATATAH